MYCERCGEDVGEDDKFCRNCGIGSETSKDKKTVKLNKTSPENTYCWNCKKEIDKKVDICPWCGSHVRITITKNSGVAAILSFFMPGLGYMYNGKIIIGILFSIIEILLFGVGILLTISSEMIEGSMLLLMGIMIWIYNIYDSYNIAEKISAEQYKL